MLLKRACPLAKRLGLDVISCNKNRTDLSVRGGYRKRAATDGGENSGARNPSSLLHDLAADKVRLTEAYIRRTSLI
jgi:hypothetical protein